MDFLTHKAKKEENKTDLITSQELCGGIKRKYLSNSFRQLTFYCFHFSFFCWSAILIFRESISNMLYAKNKRKINY